ncbi:MAG: bifunctional 5,10-methylenetetrahydrofolate dehydrogenase/5,10-methenyltetrahydrofolate cyclohydrolase [Patescibacteria group bacterium]|nr:bifunctional 5,10-methylenetetrahydrofolate dehydrogenase/5,10-methenyltetrahydrofolate cyclohydrolase [Patescibacteria group bacterium]
MCVIFDGKKAAQEIYKSIADQLEHFENPPSLAIVKTGSSPSQTKFTNMKKRMAGRLGISCDLVEHDAGVSEKALINKIKLLSENYSGILVQLPLPDHINKFTLLNSIPYEKDVEGLGAERAGELFQKIPEVYSPVAMAVIDAIEQARDNISVNIKGSNTVIVGNSYLVGMPVSQVLYKMGATVTLCGSQTQNLEEYTRKADILVSATGRKHIIKPTMLKLGCVVVDAGFDLDEKGNVFGDCDPEVEKVASFYTPVPGGIGPLTIANIFKNLLNLCRVPITSQE